MSIVINNLFFSFVEDFEEEELPSLDFFYYYVVDYRQYDAESLGNIYGGEGTIIQPFTVNLNRSEIISLVLKCGSSYTPMLYQWDFNENRFYELISRPSGCQSIVNVNILQVPDLSIPREVLGLSPYNLESPIGIERLFETFVTFVNATTNAYFPNGITNEVFDFISQLKLKLRIDNLYYYIRNGIPEYYYLISNIYYDATNLSPTTVSNNLIRFPIFEVFYEGSKPYILFFTNSENQGYPMIYQALSFQGQRLIELTPRPPSNYNRLVYITEIELAMITPGGVFRYTVYSNHAFLFLLQRFIGMEGNDIFDRILQIQPSLEDLGQSHISSSEQNVSLASPTNQPPSIIQNETQMQSLLRQSYETLIKQLYSIPVELPPFLIINGIRSNFIPFQEVAEMLQTNQIERYTIDPILQPWAGVPPVSGVFPGTSNRIITMFGKNGITYLVKARYDPQTNQISPPI
jgi:hypothetical protein